MSRTATVLAVAAVAIVLLGGSGAAACKFALSCGIGNHLVEAEEPIVDEQPLPTGVARLTAGWTEQKVLAGLNFPTDFAFFPSGDVVVTEKDGVVKVADPESKRTRVVLDIRSRVSDDDIRGLLTVTVDPSFPRNPYLYVLYTAAVRDPKAPTTSNVSRFTWRNGRLDPASEKRILTVVERRAHAGGQIVFAPDGTLFVSTGDAQHSQEVPAALVAQDLDRLQGKVLHLTRDGKGVPGNPFWNGDPSATRSKIWAFGFRNPFRLTLEPGSETPVVGDVGFQTEDEISTAPRGANNGWPCYEGGSLGPQGYPDSAVCRALYGEGESAVNFPVVSYSHDQAAAITGGTFMDGAKLGARTPLVYVFADFVHGWLRYLEVRDGRLADSPVDVGEGLPGPVALHTDKAGALYYLSAPTGQLRRIERRG
jgi:glucose/arabinose dehydrogenase